MAHQFGMDVGFSLSYSQFLEGDKSGNPRLCIRNQFCIWESIGIIEISIKIHNEQNNPGEKAEAK